MGWWSSLIALLRSRRVREADLDREIRAHLDLEAEEHAAAGSSAKDASAAARRAFGNVGRVMEDTREAWGGNAWGRLGQDLRYAWRLMRRSPVVTTAATLSLALGIGANVAIWSVCDALMLRPLTVSHPEQLVTFVIDLGAPSNARFTHLSYADFLAFRDGLQSVSAVTAIADLDRSNVKAGSTNDPGPASVHVALVSGNYFSTLGLHAASGRVLGPDDDRVPGGHPVAIISDAYWHRRWLRDGDALGRTLTVNDTAYTILGVMPAGVSGDWVGHPVDIWIPLAMQSEVMSERPGLLAGKRDTWLRILARLRPGTSMATVEAAANALLSASAGTVPPAVPVRTPGIPRPTDSRVIVESASRGFSLEREAFGAPVAIVLAIVGIILLIVCANIANLQMARATARHTEMAVRAALGAARGRLVRQSLTESALLAACAGTLALFLAVFGARTIARLMGSGPTPLSLDVALDARLLVFAFVLTVGTAAVFGLMPAAAWGRRPLSLALAGRGTGPGTSPVRFRMARALVVSQVALSLVLLVGAGLFLRTLHNLRGQDLGVDRDHVLLVQTAPAQSGVSGAAVADLMSHLTERLSALPGVESAAASTFAVLGGVGSGTRCTVAGYHYGPDEDVFVRSNSVTPDYFRTMGMTLLYGRDIRRHDISTAARVAVVNEAMARYYWGTPDAIGRRFGLARDTGDEIEVVGVVRDANTEHLREPPARTVFLPYRQDVAHLGSLAVAVRTSGPTATIRRSVSDVARAVAPQLPIVSLHTVEENVDQMLLTERLIASFSGLFGILALILTCLGLYGVMSYITVCRTNEIGVRMALGAGPGDTLRLVLGDSLWLVGVGIAVGVPAAPLVMRLAGTVLFGVDATDVPTIAAAAVLLLTVGAIASYLPARRATRVNPITALRFE